MKQISPEFLDKVRKYATRINSKSFDEEIKMCIESCRQDLILSGISEEKVYQQNNVMEVAFGSHGRTQKNIYRGSQKQRAVWQGESLITANKKLLLPKPLIRNISGHVFYSFGYKDEDFII